MSKTENFKIYIPTCNNTIYLVEALLYSLKKYWYDYENYYIIILGYKHPKFDLEKNVTFHSMNEDDPVENWAVDLKKYFENVSDKYFIYMNDDCPLSRKIDSELLQLFCNITSENENTKIGRINLTQDISNRGHNVVGDYENFQVIESHQNAQYRTSTQFSIWSREYFLKYLKQNQTPWQFELEHPKHDGYKILGTKHKYCLDFYHLNRIFGTPDNWNVSCYEKTKLEDNIDDYNFIKSVMNKGDS